MKTIIVSGYFDPLHVGHIEYFELAKKLGKLIVILNNDYQCELKKGKTFMPMEERKRILEALKVVDEVFVSIDKTRSVCESLKALAKHNKNLVFANGGDRNNKNIPEIEVCRKYNIKIVDGLGKKIQSSSELIKNGNNKREHS